MSKGRSGENRSRRDPDKRVNNIPNRIDGRHFIGNELDDKQRDSSDEHPWMAQVP
jgi:hypothetical protein